MNAEKLIIGRTYFSCTYLLRHRPIPVIETWIYLGKDRSKSDKDSSNTYHYFQDPDTFYEDEILAELTGDQVQEYESQEEPTQLRVLETDIEGFIQDLNELESFVNGLSSEPKANEAF